MKNAGSLEVLKVDGQGLMSVAAIAAPKLEHLEIFFDFHASNRGMLPAMGFLGQLRSLCLAFFAFTWLDELQHLSGLTSLQVSPASLQAQKLRS
jgi:hypothetical protein